MEQDFEIYDGKTFSELCKDIVDNQKDIQTQIDFLITQLKPLVKSVNDAVSIVPMLKEYIDVSVKNNEHLIKLAAITNKIKTKYAAFDMDSQPGGYESIITDEEKADIARAIKDLQSGQSQLRIEQVDSTRKK